MINQLPEELVNKIAAGEVVERPVNVVKELVENAVDAGANILTITLNENLIRIEDNGVGMTPEDLEKCVLRHATSKINSFDDLKAVQSFGFRGEALSSIAAVSNLRIRTKHESSIEGKELHVEGGAVPRLKNVGCSQGTTVEVRDLFFNTPVRKKFLDLREDHRIVSFIEKFALGTKVKVVLIRKGRRVLDVSSIELLDRIAQVYGVDLVAHMRKVDHEEYGIKVSGYVSAPTFLRRDRMQQAIFVNSRLVESAEIQKGIYEAYKSILFVQKHPVAVLKLEVKEVDVNVHPAKKIVKFSLPEKVQKVVYNAVHEVFAEKMEIFEAQHTFEGDFEKAPKPVLEPRFKDQPANFQIDTQVEFETPEIVKVRTNKEFEKLPEMRIIGNLSKMFFLAEGEDGLYLIDQHVVDERINYEKFMAQFMNEKVERQKLLSPELVEFGLSDVEHVRKNMQRIESFGYNLEDFGENTFRLTSVPLLFNKVMGLDYLRELFAEFKEEKKEKIVTRMACRNAIKAGDTVSNYQMANMLKVLDKCELPFTCPHGRPTIIKISLDDMEKMFRRKGFN